MSHETWLEPRNEELAITPPAAALLSLTAKAAESAFGGKRFSPLLRFCVTRAPRSNIAWWNFNLKKYAELP